jgi:hypothetical protein
MSDWLAAARQADIPGAGRALTSSALARARLAASRSKRSAPTRTPVLDAVSDSANVVSALRLQRDLCTAIGMPLTAALLEDALQIAAAEMADFLALVK